MGKKCEKKINSRVQKSIFVVEARPLKFVENIFVVIFVFSAPKCINNLIAGKIGDKKCPNDPH